MFQKKTAAIAADPDVTADLASPPGVSPAVSLGGGKEPTKKAFGGARALSAGGGGGSKFGGFKKGGGVASFKGGKR